MHMITNRKLALVIDDSEEARLIYSTALKSIGFDAVPLSGLPSRDFFENRSIDLILLDMNLGNINSIDYIKDLAKHSDAKIVVMTAFGGIESAVAAVHNGASGFFVKSDPIDSLLPKIQALFQAQKSIGRVETFLEECGIKGTSRAMKSLGQLIMQVGPTASTVLISGSSGAGKELIAHAIHKSSGCNGPFVAINCSAIPDQLLESELFGVKRGAFTDAKQDRQGVLDAAAGGTIFLDEIGEMPLPLQSKLLRVIQECEFTPLGGTQPVKMRARIVCATNRNLIQMMADGKFREDLYYRIAVITLKAPDLSERSADIPILIEHFLGIYNRKCGKHLKMPLESELSILASYPWPGNVRELQNAVERATVLGTGDRLSINLMLPPTQVINLPQTQERSGPQRTGFNYKTSIDAFERTFLTDLLAAANGNMSEAARLSGIYRANIYRMAKRLNISLKKD
jgi:DNA-binding NtrC family response regulator